MTIQRINSRGHLSKAVVHNGIAYLAGMTADDDTQDIKGQMAQVLSAIDETLAAAGTDKSKLLSSMVYLSDMSVKAEMNACWMDWIDLDNPPARATVGTVLGTPGKLVEIMVQAAV
ncbi:MAG: RidA family protein [Rhodospirillaceae bacterium]|jgi:enamine deaminase RidA (YjgF/YER057c/UK114 family)|nr:RidA family protein [Rhodospirillales bacterium]MBT3906703.1 RidA family protein [Rhodospirillaceae bacterium]MBT4700497.1 RidA family protein [Rhodospirillaceae bacterium]MBT5033465.1 RidA family protein [Rhodospirillaceae bacterium]MBT6221341.1 RidA family protein [Rhodospirillaceae bacterium]